MRDPHVVSLEYRVLRDEKINPVGFPVLEGKTNEFRYRLDKEGLRIDMIKHYGSADYARRPIETFLRSWEVDQALRFGKTWIRFEYKRHEIIDRNPLPSGTAPSAQPEHLSVQPSDALVGLADSAKAELIPAKYPDPPKAFEVSPDVETLWSRYRGFQRGKEPLASMAYVCLTFLESNENGRKELGREYAIDIRVLQKLGELSSIKGDDMTARKFSKMSTRKPHTGAELAWIEEAVKLLIRRAGERAARPNSSLPKITLQDLPRL